MKLGDRLKNYEKEFERKIDKDNFIIIRIDGHGFSKFTKNFKKPFDENFSNAMEKTTIDLCKEFNAITGYTQSDEITLILNKQSENHIYSGRIQKIVSLIASFTSIRFNYYLNNKTLAWFDARVFGIKDESEVFNSILWRYRDCIRNSKSAFAGTYCNHKNLMNKNSDERIEFCLIKTDKDWNLINNKYKYGIFIKKEEYLNKDCIKRTRFKSFIIKELSFLEENVKLIISKYKKGEKLDK